MSRCWRRCTAVLLADKDLTLQNGGTCQCRPCCSYPNGVVPVVSAQIILLLGVATSFYTILDCKAVQAKAASVDPFLATLFPRSNTSNYYPTDRKHTGMGLLVFEDMNGNCAYDAYSGEYDDDENANPIIVNGKNMTSAFEAYLEYTDSFNVARAMIASAALLGLIGFIWLSLWSCWAQRKLARWFWVFGMFPVITLLQGLTLLILRSDFCDEHECVLGQALAFTILGAVCYMTAGIIIFCWSKNYNDDVVIDRFARPAHLVELSGELQPRGYRDDMHPEGSPNERVLSADVEQHGSHSAVAVAEIVAPPMIDGVSDAQEVPVDPMLIQSILGSSDERKLATMQQQQQQAASDDSSE